MGSKKKYVNLFEDKRGDWEYGYVQFPDDGLSNSGKRVEIRRRTGAGLRDESFMLIDGEWQSMCKPPDDDPNYENMSLETLYLTCAVCSAVSSALNVADNWKTHNSQQKIAGSGRAKLSMMG